jgi:predicted dehydrogenase
MKKINWGVIGLGNIAQQFLESFSEVRNAKLIAIASNDKHKLEEYKNKFDINKDFIFNDYKKLIMCSKVDIVYISLPNCFHFYWIKKCIENKKKFLVEKPATINFQEAINLKSIIENNNLFFAEGFMYRYDPLITQMIDLIKNDEIGDLLSLESSFGINILTKKKFFFFKKKRKINKNSRQFSKQLGGGCILDLGCYPTSLTILIASLIKNLDYTNFEIKVLNREIGETDVDINSEAQIIFQNGFKSNVKASFKHNLGNNTLVKGKKGEINIKNTFLGIEEIEVNLKNKKYKINKRINRNIYAIEIENISQSILQQKNDVLYPGMKIEETFVNMKILENWRNNEL